LFLMAGLPLIYNVVMSFQEVDMFSLGTFSRPFVGFKNYTYLFAQPETLPILYNTVIRNRKPRGKATSTISKPRPSLTLINILFMRPP
ncbi:hypothetical protein AB9F39_36520, partial [Rhizobium leguminosarum]